MKLLVHHLPGPKDVGFEFELDEDDRDSHRGMRTHPENVGRSVHHPLYRQGDQGLHFFGGQAVAFGENGYGRRGEVRKDVHRHFRRDIASVEE